MLSISKAISLIAITIPFISYSATKIEYSDVVLEHYYSNANSNFNNFYGGTISSFPVSIDTNSVVGSNNSFVSLPTGSYVTVGFTDNTIIDAPGQDDVFIEEIGGNGERAEVYVSSDNNNFVLLGIAQDDKVTSFDLEKINFKSPVVAVKVIGLDAKGGSPGFDLVSVKAHDGSGGIQPSLRNLTVDVIGEGKVTSSLFGINCLFDCAEDYVEGSYITLTATPENGFAFEGWSGYSECGLSKVCSFPLNTDVSVQATFGSICHSSSSYSQSDIDDAYQKGRLACINDPSSCGISINLN